MSKQGSRSGKGKPDIKRGKSHDSSERGKKPFEKFIKKKSTGRSFPPKRSAGSDEGRPPGKRPDFRERDGKTKDSRLGNANKENPRRSYSREDKPSRSEGFRSKDKREKPNFRESRETRNAPYRPYKKEERSERPANSEIREGKKQRTFKPRPGRSSSEQDRKFSGADRGEFKRRGERGQKPSFRETTSPEKRFKRNDFVGGKGFETPRFSKDQKQKRPAKPKESLSAYGLIRLNKYLSNAGVASRRDADDLISSGAVKVNGIVVDQLGYKIKPTDKVTYGDQAVKGERKVYLLLNKPKDYITTMDDPQERRTVMQLISGACKERVYPVGRLDRNTTGLLLFTNDGELAAKLTHPKHGIKKVYHVSLNKGLKADDFKAIIDGVELEDGLVKADDLAFVGEGKKEIGIEIHSGRNRVVRRLFEHLGYDVIKLDRVAFAGLSKKELPRGKHRFLTAKEISFLQMIG